MGKPGGFFKKLKAKQQRSASNRRRGTKGASKEERRAKHNELVDYYAAKREAEELAAISSSSDEGESTDSEVEAKREKRSLMRLRQMLGVGDTRKGGRANQNDSIPNGNGSATKVKKSEKGEEEKEEESAKGSDDDWQVYLSGSSGGEEEEEEEEEFDEEEEDEENSTQHKGIEEDEEDEEDITLSDAEYEEDDNDEEEEEEEEALKEDVFDAEAMDAEAEADGAALLLPSFRHGTTPTSALVHVVSPSDPWLAKYHADQHGALDHSPMQPLDTHHGANLCIRASAHAVRHFLHTPFAPSREEMKRMRVEEKNGNGQTKSATRCEEVCKPVYMHDALWAKWQAYCVREGRGPLTGAERGLLDLLQGYPDVMDCTRDWDNSDSRREVFLLHMLNHWFKARAVTLAHDRLLAARCKEAKQKRAMKEKKEVKGKGGKSASGAVWKNANKVNTNDNSKDSAEEEEEEEEYELRDRGFGKTRLLLMLPLRNIAHRYVNTLVRLIGAAEEDCPKLSTFNEDFTELEEAIDPTFKRRPRDYQRQFAGNIDDSFCVGVRLQPNRVSVYAHPLNSDLIICSPLGLRRRLERNGDALVSLASIEVCLVDEAHVLLMQNWQHAAAVLAMLNKRPKDTTRGLSDLRRVYAWALEGHSGRHRQTILSSNVSHATLLATFRSFVNNSGRLVLQRREEVGALAQVMVPVRQHFIRFDPGETPESGDDARFDFFTQKLYATKIHPLVERDVRTIVFVPSYFDFVRLRNYMIRDYRDSFAAISEYTSIQQQRKALGQFTDLERPLLIVTERFYFFKRYFVKFAEAIVFYSPPVFAPFYVSLVNRLVATSPNVFALTLFCRFDTHELNRLVGTRRARQLLERESDTFSFVTN